MNKLYPELVSEIFLLAASENEELVTPSVHRIPLVLGRVCSRWKQISYSTPHLWNRVLFSTDSSKEYPARGLKSWLLRSKSLPLFIKFVWHGATPNNLQPFMAELADTFERWTCLSLATPLCGAINILLGIGGCGGLINLRQLNLDISGEEPFIFSRNYLDYFVNLSSLHITQRGYHSFFRGLERRPPYSTMRSLSVNTWISQTDFFRIVHVFSHLETLKIELYADLENNRNEPVVELPHLKTFQLGVTSISWCVLDKIRLPALRSFHIFATPRKKLIGALSSLFKRSEPSPLEELRLRLTSISARELTEILHHIPKLKLLSIWPIHFDTNILRSLTLPGNAADDNNVLVPRLETFEFMDWSHNREAIFLELSEMIRSRSKESCQHWRLRNLTAVAVCGDELLVKRLKQHPDLQPCVANGLSIFSREYKDRWA